MATNKNFNDVSGSSQGRELSSVLVGRSSTEARRQHVGTGSSVEAWTLVKNVGQNAENATLAATAQLA